MPSTFRLLLSLAITSFLPITLYAVDKSHLTNKTSEFATAIKSKTGMTYLVYNVSGDMLVQNQTIRMIYPQISAYDPSGVLRWLKQFPDLPGPWTPAYDIAASDDGYLFLLGRSQGARPNSDDLIVLKLAADDGKVDEHFGHNGFTIYRGFNQREFSYSRLLAPLRATDGRFFVSIVRHRLSTNEKPIDVLIFNERGEVEGMYPAPMAKTRINDAELLSYSLSYDANARPFLSGLVRHVDHKSVSRYRAFGMPVDPIKKLFIEGVVVDVNDKELVSADVVTVEPNMQALHFVYYPSASQPRTYVRKAVIDEAGQQRKAIDIVDASIGAESFVRRANDGDGWQVFKRAVNDDNSVFEVHNFDRSGRSLHEPVVLSTSPAKDLFDCEFKFFEKRAG